MFLFNTRTSYQYLAKNYHLLMQNNYFVCRQRWSLVVLMREWYLTVNAHTNRLGVGEVSRSTTPMIRILFIYLLFTVSFDIIFVYSFASVFNKLWVLFHWKPFATHIACFCHNKGDSIIILDAHQDSHYEINNSRKHYEV